MTRAQLPSFRARGLRVSTTTALALAGIAAALLAGGCGGTTETPDMASANLGWKDIQADLVKSCSTGIPSCHSPAAATNALKIDATAGKEMTNFTLVTTMFVNKTTPASSPLLAKPVDAGHGGGAVFTTNSATYQRWLKWVTQGAPFDAVK